MNPYEVLGVDKNATEDQIKRAYRVIVRKVHPDTGGNAEDFNRVQESYDLLSDKARRAYYDRTGDTRPPQPGARESKAVYLVSLALSTVLEELINNGRSPSEEDIIDCMKQCLNSRKEFLIKERKTCTAKRKAFQEVVDLFVAADKDTTLNDMVQSQLQIVDAKLLGLDEDDVVLKDALAIIKKYSFKRKQKKVQAASTSAATGILTYFDTAAMSGMWSAMQSQDKSKKDKK